MSPAFVRSSCPVFPGWLGCSFFRASLSSFCGVGWPLAFPLCRLFFLFLVLLSGRSPPAATPARRRASSLPPSGRHAFAAFLGSSWSCAFALFLFSPFLAAFAPPALASWPPLSPVWPSAFPPVCVLARRPLLLFASAFTGFLGFLPALLPSLAPWPLLAALALATLAPSASCLPPHFRLVALCCLFPRFLLPAAALASLPSWLPPASSLSPSHLWPVFFPFPRLGFPALLPGRTLLLAPGAAWAFGGTAFPFLARPLLSGSLGFFPRPALFSPGFPFAPSLLSPCPFSPLSVCPALPSWPLFLSYRPFPSLLSPLAFCRCALFPARRSSPVFAPTLLAALGLLLLLLTLPLPGAVVGVSSPPPWAFFRLRLFLVCPSFLAGLPLFLVSRSPLPFCASPLSSRSPVFLPIRGPLSACSVRGFTAFLRMVPVLVLLPPWSCVSCGLPPFRPLPPWRLPRLAPLSLCLFSVSLFPFLCCSLALLVPCLRPPILRPLPAASVAPVFRSPPCLPLHPAFLPAALFCLPCFFWVPCPAFACIWVFLSPSFAASPGLVGFRPLLLVSCFLPPARPAPFVSPRPRFFSPLPAAGLVFLCPASPPPFPLPSSWPRPPVPPAFCPLLPLRAPPALPPFLVCLFLPAWPSVWARAP